MFYCADLLSESYDWKVTKINPSYRIDSLKSFSGDGRSPSLAANEIAAILASSLPLFSFRFSESRGNLGRMVGVGLVSEASESRKSRGDARVAGRWLSAGPMTMQGRKAGPGLARCVFKCMVGLPFLSAGPSISHFLSPRPEGGTGRRGGSGDGSLAHFLGMLPPKVRFPCPLAFSSSSDRRATGSVSLSGPRGPVCHLSLRLEGATMSSYMFNMHRAWPIVSCSGFFSSFSSCYDPSTLSLSPSLSPRPFYLSVYSDSRWSSGTVTEVSASRSCYRAA